MQPDAAAALTDALLIGGEAQTHIPTTDSSENSKLGIIVNRHFLLAEMIKLLTNRSVSDGFAKNFTKTSLLSVLALVFCYRIWTPNQIKASGCFYSQFEQNGLW